MSAIITQYEVGRAMQNITNDQDLVEELHVHIMSLWFRHRQKIDQMFSTTAECTREIMLQSDIIVFIGLMREVLSALEARSGSPNDFPNDQSIRVYVDTLLRLRENRWNDFVKGVISSRLSYVHRSGPSRVDTNAFTALVADIDAIVSISDHESVVAVLRGEIRSKFWEMRESPNAPADIAAAAIYLAQARRKLKGKEIFQKDDVVWQIAPEVLRF